MFNKLLQIWEIWNKHNVMNKLKNIYIRLITNYDHTIKLYKNIKINTHSWLQINFVHKEFDGKQVRMGLQ
jgi:hypothetical protein